MFDELWRRNHGYRTESRRSNWPFSDPFGVGRRLRSFIKASKQIYKDHI
jgi:hypothetical protein